MPHLYIPKTIHKVLDFGCGTGWVIGGSKASHRVERFGIDISHQALQRGSGEFKNVHFCVANGTQLPFCDSTFDALIGHVSLPYMKTAVALREIFRVLKPGGSFFLTSHSLVYWRRRFWSSLSAGNIQDACFMTYALCNAMLLHASLPQTQCWWNRKRFETVHTMKGLQRACASIGFTYVSAEYAPQRIYFSITARKPNSGDHIVHQELGWAIEDDLYADDT